jgi:hypothetical protein
LKKSGVFRVRVVVRIRARVRVMARVKPAAGSSPPQAPLGLRLRHTFFFGGYLSTHF